MSPWLSREARRALGGLGAAAAGVGMAIGLSGCPHAAPLENSERFEALDTPAGPSSCDQALPDEATLCAYREMLQAHCSRSGCHSKANHSAGLNLEADPLLIARILDVPARHPLNCGGGVSCDPAMPACDECTACPTGDLLLDPGNVAESWLIKKMDAFDVTNPTSVVDMHCGSAMPYPPGNDPPDAPAFSDERRACLKQLFTWIAENGRPCTIEPADGGAD